MQGTLPHPQVRPKLAGFVGLAADADGEDERIFELASRIDAMMLPFVMILNAEGEFLTGYGGVGSPPRLLSALAEVL